MQHVDNVFDSRRLAPERPRYSVHEVARIQGCDECYRDALNVGF
jgi:hypothetical protein